MKYFYSKINYYTHIHTYNKIFHITKENIYYVSDHVISIRILRND